MYNISDLLGWLGETKCANALETVKRAIAYNLEHNLITPTAAQVATQRAEAIAKYKVS